MVNNVENYFKNTLNIGNAFQTNNANGNNKNAYGIVSFLKDNIFYFVIFVFVVLIIVYAIHLIRRKVNKGGLTTIKSDYQVYRVDNDIIHNPVNNSQIECPSNLSKYSFAFFIELDDFYCNEGYWRALMVKGHEMDRANSLCTGGSFGEGESLENLLQNISDQDIQDYLNDMSGGSSKVRKINVDSFSKRLQLVCKAIETDDIHNVCNLNEEHKIFQQGGKDIPMTKGQCLNFFKEHETYCNNVYKTDRKVARNRDSTDTDMTDDRKFDNYDNICSDGNLRDKFPELLPRNLSALKDVELINLAEQMDVKNGEDKENQTNLEGCYVFNTDLFDGPETLSNQGSILNNCNNVAIGKSNYFGLVNDGTGDICYTLKITEEDNLNDFKSSEDKCADRKGNNVASRQHIYISKSLRPEENILRECWEDLINTYPIQNPGVWLHPFINDLRIVVTTKSDEDNYEIYQNENLHPYQNKNNLNVNQVTNYSEEDLRLIKQEYNNELKTIEDKIEQSRKSLMEINTSDENLNEEIRSISNRIVVLSNDKKNIVDKYEEIIRKRLDENSKFKFDEKNSCNLKSDSDQNYYREYFDVKNIPIKEKFHLAVVINEKLVEVFINGQLHTSQILFGNPEYNSGPLHISPGKKANNQKLDLHGIITDFKYFRRALTFNQIRSILKEKSFKDFDNAVVMPEEHAHKVEVVHEHPHDVINEGDHLHNVDESNIKPEFYLEE